MTERKTPLPIYAIWNETLEMYDGFPKFYESREQAERELKNQQLMFAPADFRLVKLVEATHRRRRGSVVKPKLLIHVRSIDEINAIVSALNDCRMEPDGVIVAQICPDREVSLSFEGTPDVPILRDDVSIRLPKDGD